MVELFLSCVCDYCDSKPDLDKLHHGWIIHRDLIGPGFPHYVFSTAASALRWYTSQINRDGVVKLVLSHEPFRWRPSRGTLRNIEFADHLFEVYPDHRFPKGPHRAFLSPVDYQQEFQDNSF